MSGLLLIYEIIPEEQLYGTFQFEGIYVERRVKTKEVNSKILEELAKEYPNGLVKLVKSTKIE
jgi:hypothetical protein